MWWFGPGISRGKNEVLRECFLLLNSFIFPPNLRRFFENTENHTLTQHIFYLGGNPLAVLQLNPLARLCEQEEQRRVER